MAEEEDRPSSGFKRSFAPARKLAVSSGQFKFSTKILAGMVRWSEPVRMVLGNIRESPTNQKIEQGILIRTPVPCLGAGWPPLCPGGYAPRFDPRPRGVLPQALRALFLGGAAPVPLFLLVRVTKNPQPLSSTTYLRGEEVCLATRLGQIDVAEAN